MAHLVHTIGDPSGIGPEITAKALQRLSEFADTKITVVGNLDGLMKAANVIGVTLPQSDSVSYYDITGDKPGLIAYQALVHAATMLAAGEADALVTGPISKKNLHDAGHEYPGHTEILETLTHKIFNEPAAKAEMLFAYKKFRLLLLTRHIALKDVPLELAKSGAVARPLKALIHFLRHKAKVDEPRIALLGLNPHAGETSGDEEKKYITPVIHAVNNIGASKLDGPFPADAFFRGFDPATPSHDAIVACYHDQGLIPFKMFAGFEAVNITIGLPFIRTSVSHGTADDIVGKNLANENSLMAALKAALELAPQTSAK